MNIARSLRSLLLAAAAAAILSAPARAEDPLVTHWRGEVEGWIFAPAYAPGGGSVLGFLAWAQPTILVGDNVSVLWYQRGPDDTWTVWGWKTGDFVSAVQYARNTVAHPTLWAAEADIASRLAAPPGGEPLPTRMIDGLFIDDPNAPAIQQAPNPAATIDAAAGAGYAAAPTLSTVAVYDSDPGADQANPAPCTDSASLNTADMMNRITFEAESAMFGKSTVEMGDDICCWCPCSTYETITGWIELGSYFDNGMRRCMYRKGREVIRTCAGKHLRDCTVCSSTTVVETDFTWGETIVAMNLPCPGYTQGGGPATIYPERPAWWP